MTGILLGLSDPHPDQLVRSEVRIRGSGSASGSVPKCYESGTLVISDTRYIFLLNLDPGIGVSPRFGSVEEVNVRHLSVHKN